MSRIVDIKRPELVVAAFAKLVLKFPHLQLVMAGSDAGQLAATKALVEALDLQDRVHFLGFLQGDLKNAVFSHARVFVLPSLHENFGVAVIEAMSHGIPVVVTRGVASHQYVDESQCGLTVDGNADAIAAAIAQILNSDGASMGNRGKDYVQRNLAWPEIGRQIDEMYFASTT